MTPDEQPAIFGHQVVFISDLHLGSGKTATPYLYEFLTNLDLRQLKELYLVGDVIGGWEHINEKQRPFPEMEKRVLDVINYAAANGVKVHVLPGNHDEQLRPILDKLNNRKNHKTFGPNVVFENEVFYDTEGPESKRLKVIHGDQFDPHLFVKPWFRPIAKAVSGAYDLMVAGSYHYSNFVYRNFHLHVSPAKAIKQNFKKMIGKIFSNNAIMEGIDTTRFDGILMGHTHTMGSHEFTNENGKKSYLINDGDWVESGTYAYVNDRTQLPQVVDYKKERERLGFGDLPDVSDPHPAMFAAYRAQTDRQLKLAYAMWPAENRSENTAQYKEACKQYRHFREERRQLSSILKDLNNGDSFDTGARDVVKSILDETRFQAYKTQKAVLKRIFDKYAANDRMEPDDLISVKILLREFKVRSERKMRRHSAVVRDMAAKLDRKFAF